MSNCEDEVLAAIDALERDVIGELVDWQLTDSKAAWRQHSGGTWPPVTTPDGVLVERRGHVAAVEVNWPREAGRGHRRVA